MTQPGQFHATQWTRVLAARGATPEAQAALGELCERYYLPVVVFLKRDGRDEDDARDLAHDFFARILGGSALDGADPAQGRFRSYLLGALKHFITTRREYEGRHKRAAAHEHIPLDTVPDDNASAPGLQLPDTASETPDTAFDRQWAQTLLERAFAKLEARCHDDGKTAHFISLKPWLAGQADHGTQAAAATALGLSDTALRVVIHRLRQKMREHVLAEITATLGPGSSAEDELASLFAAFRTE